MTDENAMNIKQIEELVLQSLEHELGGVNVYTTALGCAVNQDLKAEWQEYLEQTKAHVSALETLCSALGLDPARETPGRRVVRHVGAALVEAMNLAASAGDPAAAELVACESVVLAETKDHADWQLLSKCAEHLDRPVAAAFKAACSTIEDQEDEHLLSYQGVVPRAVGSGARIAGGAAATRRAAASEDRHRRRARRATRRKAALPKRALNSRDRFGLLSS